MNTILKARILLFLIYLFSIIFSWKIADSFGEAQLLLQMAIAYLVFACLIFSFSFFFNNSSLFDPYWSIAPLFIFCYLLWHTPAHWFFVSSGWSMFLGRWYGFARIFVSFILISWWGGRLTWNFLRNWKGLKHEDWRYTAFRQKTGKAYWLVSFLGIHLFPAFMIFLGSLSIWVILSFGMRPFGIIDLVALFVTGFAIWLETKADRQLHEYTNRFPGIKKTLDKGLWAVSRHPNYLGEISFWCGLYLFALAANPAFWWVIIGPLAILMMFAFISIPMIEKRMASRYDDYSAYTKNVCRLFPWKCS